MASSSRSAPYGQGGVGQPRVDRDLLRFLWREDCSRVGQSVSYGIWRSQKLALMDAERKANAEQVAARDAAEKEAQRLEHGPWTSLEWQGWHRQQWELQQQAEKEASLNAQLLQAVAHHAVLQHAVKQPAAEAVAPQSAAVPVVPPTAAETAGVKEEETDHTEAAK